MKIGCLTVCYVLMLFFPALAQGVGEDIAGLSKYAKFSDIELVERPDDIDKDEYHAFVVFGRPLHLGGELQFAAEFMGDYELDDAAEDDLLEIEPALILEVFYPLTDKWSVYLEGEVQYFNEFQTEIGERYRKWVLERTESWVFWGNMLDSNFSLQIGRQSYEDQRRWWWDEELDSIRLHYDRTGFHTEIAAARELMQESTEHDRMDPEDEDIFRLLSHTAWSRNKDLRLDAFALYQEDQSSRPEGGEIVRLHEADEIDADLFWYGAGVSGEAETDGLGEFAFWVDAAGVTGDEKLFEFEKNADGDRGVADVTRRDVAGWGIDGGITWHTGIFADMALTLGYALGSGDRDPEDRKDHSFRRTGITEGDRRFQYYGELLNPDLSNLQIWTASIEFSLGEDSFIVFIYHDYRQVHPSDFLRETDLEADPEGIRRSVGEEYDVVLNSEDFENFEIQLSGAMFKAGDAFGALSGETAYRVFCEINFRF